MSDTGDTDVAVMISMAEIIDSSECGPSQGGQYVVTPRSMGTSPRPPWQEIMTDDTASSICRYVCFLFRSCFLFLVVSCNTCSPGGVITLGGLSPGGRHRV